MAADEVDETIVVFQVCSNGGFPCRHRQSRDLWRGAAGSENDAAQAQDQCSKAESEHVIPGMRSLAMPDSLSQRHN